ncbi:MAG: DUF2071 domain-containing protein [Anaerolineae bacterium]|nr:DUF2071 domain-containing protein [Anaerolineae bacterium]
MIFNNPAQQSPKQLLQLTEHRSYPIPQGRWWVMAQTWQRLLFAHYPIPVATLRPMIPPELEIDTWDGTAWIGIVPFRMTGVRLRGLPPVPFTHTFPELNVRTYVVKDGIAGVWFFSLDAANPLAVFTARRWFHLPYYHADMTISEQGDNIQYHSYRSHRGATKGVFVGSYRPTGSVQDYAPDSHERWLTERYALYAANKRGKLYRGDIQHQLWSVQPAEANIEQNSIVAASGIALPDTKPLLHYVHHIDVITWALKAL